jgi:peptidoglycan/LPS O-acetylase OafA/YrhL
MGSQQSAERYANLDGLRLLCALAVLLFHFGYRGSLEGLYAPLLSWTAVADVMKYGHIGVHIFFVISGFVIAYSSAGRSPMAFAIARFARIYPTFIVCLTVLFSARWMWGGAELPTSLAQYLAGFTMVPQLFQQKFMSGVYWSIAVELLFYGWVFLFMAAGLFQRHRMVIIAVWLGLSAANELFLGLGAVRVLLITEFAPFFAFGMLLNAAQIGRRLEWPIGLLMGIAMALGVFVLLRETADIRTSYGITMSDAVSVGLLTLGIALTILAVEVKQPVLPGKLLLWAGGISYPLYLLHEGLGQVAFVSLRTTMNGTVLFFAASVLVISLASAIWWGFDRFAVAWTRKMLENSLATALPRLAVALPRRPTFS